MSLPGEPSSAVTDARTQERLALAETLHDGLTQLLTATSAYLDAYRLARERQEEERARFLLSRGMETLEASVEEIRRLMRDLREGASDAAGPERAETARASIRGDEPTE